MYDITRTPKLGPRERKGSSTTDEVCPHPPPENSLSAAMSLRGGFSTISAGALMSIVVILLVLFPWMPPMSL